MDGKNASGRRISLLNDSAEPRPLPIRLPSISPSLRSRTSSYTSSPIGSPPTPQLVRSDSSDSTAMRTPSPITPEFTFEGLPSANMPSPVFAQASFFPSQKDLNAGYSAAITHSTGPLPYHSAAPQYAPQQSVENLPAAPSANPRSKKNSYPCPMAKQFHCNDYFTTSGHAARHAKKHTGKKDAFCPECNKAFTRKDNMEQHRRTHQSGRNASKTTDSAVKKAKQQAKRPKPTPLPAAMPSMPSIATLSMVDPALSSANINVITPTLDMAGPSLSLTDSFSSAYPDPTAFSMAHNYPTGSSYGLDALAIAASGEKRKYEI
ncbi:hypothetical protein BU24DRAFT_105099 [Aaosphaeria arxii CBS 175.79]|uniref:C2H2-type domain-containing protein n=1 Tax=Aaosphaeria arxii CBS 175.79 TaxID=1450172 RepID=A0A6A5Y0R5_9PLEO|nr:uncharacterized protein BU24DRAFT_105099 [Aaosphaeria arxii CBS 175.79]KAF2018783.1 hypothetical protein BU24DRAFT_105099 [Aaosphaeria arxii CBS 175.79]